MLATLYPEQWLMARRVFVLLCIFVGCVASISAGFLIILRQGPCSSVFMPYRECYGEPCVTDRGGDSGIGDNEGPYYYDCTCYHMYDRSASASCANPPHQYGIWPFATLMVVSWIAGLPSVAILLLALGPRDWRKCLCGRSVPGAV